MNIDPRGEWVVVKPVEATKNINGLWVPDSVQQAYSVAEVVAVPTHDHKETFDLHIGDHVIYDRVGSVSVRIGSETVIMLKGREILGKLVSQE